MKHIANQWEMLLWKNKDQDNQCSFNINEIASIYVRQVTVSALCTPDCAPLRGIFTHQELLTSLKIMK